MKLLGCLFLITVVAMTEGGKPYYDVNNAPILFENFVKDYNKKYKSEADKEEHYKAFVKTLEIVNEANAASSSATFDINDFADYTREEQKRLFGLRPEQNKN